MGSVGSSGTRPWRIEGAGGVAFSVEHTIGGWWGKHTVGGCWGMGWF